MEFRVFKLKENSKHKDLLKFTQDNEFIVVCEDEEAEEYVLVHPINREKGLQLLADMKIDEFALGVLKDELISTNNSITFDIPKKHLTLDILESIQKITNP